MRVLLAGFGPFPGAPFNPSARLVKALARRRRPALAGIERSHARLCHRLCGGRSRSAETVRGKARHRADIRPRRAPPPALHRDARPQRRLGSVSRRQRISAAVSASSRRASRDRAAARRHSCAFSARCGRARFRRGCRAMPDVISATMPIGARCSERATACRWCSSFIFRRSGSPAAAAREPSADFPTAAARRRGRSAADRAHCRKPPLTVRGENVACSGAETADWHII